MNGAYPEMNRLNSLDGGGLEWRALEVVSLCDLLRVSRGRSKLSLSFEYCVTEKVAVRLKGWLGWVPLLVSIGRKIEGPWEEVL